MANLTNLSKLSERVKTLVVPYALRLIEIYAATLRSIMVYGSAAQGGDFVPGHSDINLLIILDEIALSDLKKGAKFVSTGRRQKKIVPLFLTLQHINTSSDVFPVDFLELKENHVLIYGDEVFDKIVIQLENIRLQCESTLKGQLIKLRQGYLELAAKPELLERLMIRSLIGLIPTLRNIMRLKGRTEIPVRKDEVINRLGKECEMDTAPLSRVLQSKLRMTKISRVEMESVFGQYLDVIQRLAAVVDEWKPGKGLQ